MWILAWRNLWRNRTRSLITGAAISLSFALMLIMFGIQESEYQKIFRTVNRTSGGSFLVHGKGYWADPDEGAYIAQPDRTLERLAQVPGVRTTLPRVLANALVSSARGNAGIQLRGIDPEAEKLLQDLGADVEGNFLTAPPRRRAPPIVLSQKVANKLGIGLGDKVVMTATDPDGEMVRALFKLEGILRTGAGGFTEIAAFTTVAAAQRALYMPGRLTQIGVLVNDETARHRVRDAAQAAVADSSLEMLTWDESIPQLLAFIEVDRRMGTLLMFGVCLIVAFGITNTFLMVVLERIRELGLLAALGMTPARVGRMLLYEALLLAIVSLAAGLVLALGTHRYLAVVGWDLSELMAGSYEFSGVMMDDLIMRSHIDWGRWLGGTVVVLMLVIGSSLYPAWRATRLHPTEAMRTYE